jgi:hypothetical protein
LSWTVRPWTAAPTVRGDEMIGLPMDGTVGLW